MNWWAVPTLQRAVKHDSLKRSDGKVFTENSKQ